MDPAPATPPDPPNLKGLWSASVQQSLCLLLGGGLLVLIGFVLGRGSVAYPVSNVDSKTPTLVTRSTFTNAVASTPSYTISLNRASLAELETLPGIGPKLAQRIVDHRTDKGPFDTVEDLRKVAGIGVKTLEKIRPYVNVRPDAFVRIAE